MTTTYDDIIVGAGSSGAVLAARLSEDPARRVLLLEAGPEYPAVETTPHDLRDSTWISVVQHVGASKADALEGREIEFPHGKVTGGSGHFTVAGSHTWWWAGTLRVSITLTQVDDARRPAGKAASTANVRYS